MEDQVRDLEHELKYIALHLREADSAEEEDDEQLRLFAKKIREIAFRAEDVVDNYILKVASSSNTNIDGNFLKKFFSFLCSGRNIYSMGKETKATHNEIQKIVEQLKQFQNTRVIAPGEGFNKPRPHIHMMQTYPHTEDTYVVGLDKVVNNLVERLINCREERIVAIVGAGGLGKTTLARQIYTHIQVRNHFWTAAWVTISQKWDQKDLLFEILRQTKGISHEERNSIKDWSEREFVEAIHHFLIEKPYLLVLDDMWEREAWNCICPALSWERFQSKVIITTRKEDLAADIGQNCIIHRPQLLSREQSWELFREIALERRYPQDTAGDDVIRVGREMTQKCGGLPLGVVTLAGLLRTKDTYEWEGVSKRFNSLLMARGPPQYGRSVYQMLTLSYYDLPNYLKPCFLYLALFPKDTEISAKRFTRMWVAEGFVAMQDELVQVNESVEEVAERFLNELIQRCLVQVVATSFTTGKAKTCRLHDLTHEFCIDKAKEQCFRQLFSSINQSTATTSTSTQLRRASILTSFSEVSLPTHDSHIRSLFQFGKKGLSLETVCADLKLLRILILHQVETRDGHLPEELGNLRHLRHLALIETNIKTLPESIGNLSNLLCLEYHLIWQFETETLPNVFWKMKLLRHLYLDSYLTFPKGLKLHTLTDLQTLWFINGNLSEAEMERLSPSLKKLGIGGKGSQRILDAVFRSPCMASGNLENLWLQWSYGVTLNSMEPLYKHCQRLRKLTLDGKIGENCPLQFPPSLVKLQLRYSELELHDPMMAAGRLDRLKYLEIWMAYRGAEITCNAGSFPQLEELRLAHLDNLEKWRIEEGAMPRLKKLEISHCWELKLLPKELKFISSLKELEINYMPRTFCHRLFRPGDQRV